MPCMLPDVSPGAAGAGGVPDTAPCAMPGMACMSWPDAAGLAVAGFLPAFLPGVLVGFVVVAGIAMPGMAPMSIVEMLLDDAGAVCAGTAWGKASSRAVNHTGRHQVREAGRRFVVMTPPPRASSPPPCGRAC